jgi:hypothetical protein
MAENVEFLHREIERLNRALGDQEARIAALEKEATEFREIEAQLLRAISLANSEFRALVRTARSARAP